MENFWVMKGWFLPTEDGGRVLTSAGWSAGETVRQEAVRFLVENVLCKDPREVTFEDFASNGLKALLDRYYEGSRYRAVKSAGFGVYPWEMGCTPRGYFKSKSNRIEATKWLVRKIGKAPSEIICDDLVSTPPGSALLRYHRYSAYNVLREAGYRVRPWERPRPPKSFYGLKKNRVAAEIRLARAFRKTGKELRDVGYDELLSKRHGSALLRYNHYSPFEVFREANLVRPEDEAYMRKGGRAKSPGPHP
jgi:hypothetical protein